MDDPNTSSFSPFTDTTKSVKKSRGSYNCGRCGQPKKGHVCHLPPPPSTTKTPASTTPRPPRHPNSVPRRRALSFDEFDVHRESPETEINESELDRVCLESGKLPFASLFEVLRRLPPIEVLKVASVSRGWRDTCKLIWRSAEELRIVVPAKISLRFVGSVLQKCSSLVKLSLGMQSDVDATLLACIAFSCPNLEFLEISMIGGAVNRITGDELARFVADRHSLTSLKLEGCSHLGSIVLTSSSLSSLWLSELHSLSKMVFICPNLKEISLAFSCNENDGTGLVAMMDSLGKNCPRLQNVQISSHRLSHAAVLALAAADLRGLRMLSLIFGSEITDASVAAITSSYSRLELLDLSGSNISDSGIGMICNVLPGTLSRLLLALCPNITSSGIQFATAQLPLLELFDCGMTICDPSSELSAFDENDEFELQTTLMDKSHHINQKLIIKHAHLKKLSFWGCSGLDALDLNCPELVDLNLNSCKNLHPERLLLQCPSVEIVYASECHESLIGAIRSQVNSEVGAEGSYQLPCKRLADGSKRVCAPDLLIQRQPDDQKKRRRIESRPCKVIVD